MAAARISSRLAAAGFLLWAAAAGAQESAQEPEAVQVSGDTVDGLEIPLPEPRPAAGAIPEGRQSVPGAAAPAGRTPQVAAAAAAVDPVTTGSAGRRSIADDPYEPLGIRAGSLILLPSVTLTAGYSTNATASSGGGAAGELTVAPQLEIQSDWTQHRARLLLRGAYETYSDGSIEPKPTATVAADGRVDLIDGWVVDLAGMYNLDQQSLSDPDYPAAADSAPAIHNFSGEATVRKTVGPLLLDVGGRVERSVYENGTGAGGVVIDQGDRSYTLYEERVRAGTDLGGALSPFVEGKLFQRIYDREVDSGGLHQDGHGYQLRAGLAIDSAPVLAGEVAVGYRREMRDDPALETLDAVTFDGSLAWSPMPLFSVATNVGTSLSPSNDLTTQGSVTYSGALELAYAHRDNLTFRLNGSVDAEKYIGTGAVDYTFALGTGASWRLNRFVQIDTDYQHEWLNAADASRNYRADTVTVGLTLRR